MVSENCFLRALWLARRAEIAQSPHPGRVVSRVLENSCFRRIIFLNFSFMDNFYKLNKRLTNSLEKILIFNRPDAGNYGFFCARINCGGINFTENFKKEMSKENWPRGSRYRRKLRILWQGVDHVLRLAITEISSWSRRCCHWIDSKWFTTAQV